jgi:hypothetical protein
VGVKMKNPQPPEKGRSGFGEFVHENKLLSGFAGSALLAFVTIIIAITVGKSDGGSAPSSPTTGAVAEAPAEPMEANPDEDEDGVVDTEDECLNEMGIPPSGCPDADRDGLPSNEDQCDQERAFTSDGCPQSEDAPPTDQPSAVTKLATVILNGEREYLDVYENAPPEEIFVGGKEDSHGIRMHLTGTSPPAEFRISTNREIQRIRGWVGITSKPCSYTSTGRVAVLDGEGNQLWPESSSRQLVGADPRRFNISIASEDAVVLYGETPDTDDVNCGSPVHSATEIGWVKTELVSK